MILDFHGSFLWNHSSDTLNPISAYSERLSATLKVRVFRLSSGLFLLVLVEMKVADVIMKMTQYFHGRIRLWYFSPFEIIYQILSIQYRLLLYDKRPLWKISSTMKNSGHFWLESDPSRIDHDPNQFWPCLKSFVNDDLSIWPEVILSCERLGWVILS